MKFSGMNNKSKTMKNVANILFYIMLLSFILCFIILFTGVLEWSLFIFFIWIISAILGVMLAWIDDMNSKNKD